MRGLKAVGLALLLSIACWAVAMEKPRRHGAIPNVVVPVARAATNTVDPLIPAVAFTDALPATDKSPESTEKFGSRPTERRYVHDKRAHFHAHGQQLCASGCALSRHPTKTLTADKYRQLLRSYATGPLDESNLALETLLYFGRQTEQFLNFDSGSTLDSRRRQFLRQQLSRTHATVAIRVVDEQNEVRVSLPPTRVPLDRRHVFEMDKGNLQPLVTSGTVKRVGLEHLWTRL